MTQYGEYDSKRYKKQNSHTKHAGEENRFVKRDIAQRVISEDLEKADT